MASPKKEAATAIGNEVLKSAGKELAKQVGSDGLTGNAKVISDILDHAITGQSVVSLQVYRVDSLSGNDEFLGLIQGVQPELIKQNGVEAIIKEWSGGGSYRVVVRCHGIPDKTFVAKIHGDPMKPKPDRTNVDNNAQGGLHNLPTVNSPQAQGQGSWYAGPGFGSYLGLQQPSMMGGQGHMGEIVQMLMNSQQQLTNQLTMRQGSSAESEAVAAAKEMARRSEEELKEARRRSEQERADQRHKEEMAEMRRLIEGNKPPTENPTVEMMKAMAPVIGAVLPLYFGQKDESSKAQAAMMTAMMGTQKDSSEQALGFMKTMMERPGVEDRMAKQADTMGSFMGNMMGLMGSAMTHMQTMQPENPPFYQHAIMQLIEGASQVGGAIFAGGTEEEGEEEGIPQVIQTAPAMVAGGAPPEQLQEAPVASEDPEGQVIRREGFDTALQKIFDRIEDTTIPVQDVAFRIWKHSTSNDKLAIAWLNNPEHVTFNILGRFTETGQMELSDDRANALADALEELRDHLKNDGTPEDYLKQYNIDNSLPKTMIVNPLEVDFMGQSQPEMGKPQQIQPGEVIDITPTPEPIVTAPPQEETPVAPEGPQNRPIPTRPEDEEPAPTPELNSGPPPVMEEPTDKQFDRVIP